jgi:outer membrane protein assembly factor BamB
MEKKIFLTTAVSALLISGWPTFHGDAARTGFSDSPAPAEPRVLWQLAVGQLREFEGGGFETNWPIIYQDKIFLAGIEVRALDLKSGKILWRYRDGTVPFFPHGLTAADGKVYVTVNDTDNLQTMKVGYVYALEVETGKFLWKTQITKDPSHSLPLVTEGKLFVGDDSGTLNALDAASGKILWQKKLVGEGEIHSSPAYANGLVFIGTEGDARYQENPRNPSSMFALNPTSGEIVWQFPIDYTPDRVNLIHATPAIANGVLYFGSENGWFYALNASTGNVIWKKELARGRDMVGTSAAAGLGYGKVFVSLWSGKFLVLDQKSGETVWEFAYEGNGTDSSPVVADGKVFLGAHEGYFYCLEAETGEVLWQEKLGGPSAALANGILIVPNSLAGENTGDPETPVLVAFATEGQTSLGWAPTQVGDTLEKTNRLPLLLIFAGVAIFIFSGYRFIKVKGETKRKSR